MKLVAVFVLFLKTSVALACPFCDTPNGEAVRAGIFNETFLATLLEVASPIPVIGILIYALNRYLPE
jgi:hypothetical protein